MTGYRIHLVDGGREEFSADRCRQTGSRYVFERESPSGDWRTVHEVPVADVVQLLDGVPDPVPPSGHTPDGPADVRPLPY